MRAARPGQRRTDAAPVYRVEVTDFYAGLVVAVATQETEKSANKDFRFPLFLAELSF